MIYFDDKYKTVYSNLMPFLDKLEEKYGQRKWLQVLIDKGQNPWKNWQRTPLETGRKI